MRILGVDLSLNSTGLALLSIGDEPVPNLPRVPRWEYKTALLDNVHYQGLCISPVPAGTFERWEAITLTVAAWALHANSVVIEGYSFGSMTAYSTAIREIGGIVRYHLRKIKMPPLEVSPSGLKKFATGSGRTAPDKYARPGVSKNQVIVAVHHQYGLLLGDDDMADAFVLAKIGEAVAMGDESNVRLPAHQREVITAIKYPVEKIRKVRPRKLKFEKPIQPRLG